MKLFVLFTTGLLPFLKMFKVFFFSSLWSINKLLWSNKWPPNVLIFSWGGIGQLDSAILSARMPIVERNLTVRSRNKVKLILLVHSRKTRCLISLHNETAVGIWHRFEGIGRLNVDLSSTSCYFCIHRLVCSKITIKNIYIMQDRGQTTRQASSSFWYFRSWRITTVKDWKSQC